MKKFSIILMASALMFITGCATIGGLIGIAVSSTPSEKKIPAEFDLRPKAGRVLVLVSQPAWIQSQINFRSYLTRALNIELAKRLGFKAAQLVDYNQLAEFRSSSVDFHTLSVAEVGKNLRAEAVLFVVMGDYGLYELADSGYYKGLLGVNASLIDTATGQKLWPESSESKSIEVGFESGPKGMEMAGRRLAASAAFCVVRYFHDVPSNKFKIFDEQTQTDWERESDVNF